MQFTTATPIVEQLGLRKVQVFGVVIGVHCRPPKAIYRPPESRIGNMIDCETCHRAYYPCSKIWPDRPQGPTPRPRPYLASDPRAPANRQEQSRSPTGQAPARQVISGVTPNSELELKAIEFHRERRSYFSCAFGSRAGIVIPASLASISTDSINETFSVSLTKLIASPLAWQPKQ